MIKYSSTNDILKSILHAVWLQKSMFACDLPQTRGHRLQSWVKTSDDKGREGAVMRLVEGQITLERAAWLFGAPRVKSLSKSY